MRIKHYQDTDTLYIELRCIEVAETRDLDENTFLDLDREGKSVASPLNMQANAWIFRIFPSNKYLPNKTLQADERRASVPAYRNVTLAPLAAERQIRSADRSSFAGV